MRLKHLHVENFRALEKMEIDFLPMTVIIGENDVGKTSCMLAVKTLFESKKLDSKNDYFKAMVDREVVIEATFETTKPSPDQAEFVCDNKGSIRIRCTYPFNSSRKCFAQKSVPKDPALRDITAKTVGALRDILNAKSLITASDKNSKSELQSILRAYVSTLNPTELEVQWVEISESELTKLLPEFVQANRTT